MSAETAASVATSAPESETVPLIGGMEESILKMEKLSLKSSERGGRTVREERRLEMPRLEGNRRERPLKLVDLPEDVLREIIKEVSTCASWFGWRGKAGSRRGKWGSRQERALMRLAGNAYERPHEFVLDVSMSAPSRRSPDILALRYRMAGYSDDRR